MDVVTLSIALKKSKGYTDTQIASIAGGFHYKGSVSTSANLPLSGNKKGDAYTCSDTGHEWIWTNDGASGSASDWTDLSADLDLKQNATDNNLQTVDKTVVGAINELKSSKADKLATVKDTTTADITVAAVANTSYIYGELTDLTITWGSGSDNAEISFIFKSGSTATTLAVSTTGAKFAAFAPSANKIVEINAMWYTDSWIVLFHETAVS